MAALNLFHPERERYPIPRYLWRAFSESSAGVNNNAVFKSARRTSRPDEQIRHLDEMSRDEAKEELEEKLLWTPASKRDSELISFSSSLLWVLQHAIRKTHRDGETPSTSSVRICLLDTSKFPDDSFDSAISFLCHHDIQIFKKDKLIEHVWFEGEFFAHGIVEVTASAGSVVSFSSLVNNGLLHLFPEFRDGKSAERLAKRVLDLRNQWFHNNLDRSMSDDDLSASMLLAGCFAANFQRVAFISFLAIHNRSARDRRLISNIREKPNTHTAFEKNLPKAYYDICEQRTQFRTSSNVDMEALRYNPFWRDGGCGRFDDPRIPKSLPEVQQCCDIMDVMCLGEDAESIKVGRDGGEVDLHGPFAAISIST